MKGGLREPFLIGMGLSLHSRIGDGSDEAWQPKKTTQKAFMLERATCSVFNLNIGNDYCDDSLSYSPVCKILVKILIVASNNA